MSSGRANKKLHIVITLLGIVCLLLSGTYAWNSLNQTARNELRNIFIQEYGTLEIQKTVENTDGSKLNPLQESMEFTFTVTFSDDASYDYTIDDGEKQTLKSGETLQLRSGETAVFEQIPVGELYNVTETPVEGYITTSNGHQGNITKEGAKAEFVNKCNLDELGYLTVTKELRGADEATRKNTEFNFTAIFDGETEQTFKLKDGDKIELRGLPIGTSYEIKEEETEEEHFTSSIEKYTGQIHSAEEVTLPFVNYYHETPPTDIPGQLIVTKKVAGDEAPGDTAFGFEVIFTGKGSESLGGGQSFELKAGESKTIENLPHGVTYTIKETNSKGYWQDASTIIGKIVGGETQESVMTNRKPADGTGALTITKEVRGPDADYNKHFFFEIEIDGVKENFILSHNESKQFAGLLPGTTYTVRETNPDDEHYLAAVESYSGKIVEGETVLLPFINIHESGMNGENGSLNITKEVLGINPDPDKTFGFKVTFEGEGAPDEPVEFQLKEGESKLIENLPMGTKYTAIETDSGGYEAVVGEIKGAVAMETPTAVNFANKSLEQPKYYVNLTVEKVLKGSYPEADKKKEFKMFLTVDGKTEEFVLKGGEEKTFQVPEGAAYEVREEDYEAQKFRQTITNGTGTAAGQDIKITVTNTYVGVPKLEVMGDPPIITKVVKGKGAPKKKFQFAFVAEGKAPMPEGSSGSKKVLTLTGAGKVEAGEISFTKAGTYKYKIYEVKEDIKGWTYDTARYTVTFVVKEADGKLTCKRTIKKNGKSADKISFVNKYDKSVLGDNVIISGTKTWKHGLNPIDKQPTAIIIKLYADGKLKTQKQVTAKDHWKYNFEVPKKNEAGKKIVYTIDEEPVANYKKTIDGYDVHNVYVEPKDEDPDKPSKPDGPDGSDKPDQTPTNPTNPNKPDGQSQKKPDGSDTADTGDHSQLGLWILIVLQSIGIIVCLTYARKRELQNEGGTKNDK